ncbi:hypothetical protein CsSME_00022387 [Camellia sinensis var. sinensis]
MSLLNQLFNRGLLGAKCKTCLNLAISRMKLLQNKRDGQLKLMRKEIAQFLQVEHIIREQNIWAAYEILEMFCEFVLVRVPILESQSKENAHTSGWKVVMKSVMFKPTEAQCWKCPSELCEAVASIIFAAPRCSDLPDLLHVRNLFAAKYGKEFISAATELRPDTSVNRTVIEKLSVSAPSAELKLKVLRDIAKEYNVMWDWSKTEAEFSKKPEDLLNGPKQVYSGAALTQAPSKQDPNEHSRSNEAHPMVSAQTKEGLDRHQSPSPGNFTSMFGHDGAKSSNKNDNATPVRDLGNEVRSQSSNTLERAQAAIAAAERATAVARAAAQLVNVKFSTQKLEEP